jgi:uncharacterized protein YbcI
LIDRTARPIDRGVQRTASLLRQQSNTRDVERMAETDEFQRADSRTLAVSNAMVRLHKQQFGRGPTRSRTYFAGRDVLVSVLEDVLLPAEEKLIEMGKAEQVRDQRTALQVGTEEDFVTTVEQLLGRKVRSFVSALDAKANVIFEVFMFEASNHGPGEADPFASPGP